MTRGENWVSPYLRTVQHRKADGMFTLRKIAIEQGKESRIEAGRETNAPHLQIFKLNYNNETEDKRTIENLLDLEVGWQILLTSFSKFHRTSPIKEIITKDHRRAVFKTQTSTYELVKEGY